MPVWDDDLWDDLETLFDPPDFADEPEESYAGEEFDDSSWYCDACGWVGGCPAFDDDGDPCCPTCGSGPVEILED